MKILSRGHLLKMIENYEVETYTMSSDEHKVEKCTIIFDKMNRVFYRINWGEINDLGQIHLWFEPRAEVVKLNDFGYWFTSLEQRDFVNRIESHPIKDLSFMNTQIYFDNFNKHLFEYGAHYVINGKCVKVFSNNKNKIINGIMSAINLRAKDNLSLKVDKETLKKKANLLVSEKKIIENIIDEEVDYVVIDGLMLDTNDHYNIAETKRIIRRLDLIAQEKDFKVAFVINEK